MLVYGLLIDLLNFFLMFFEFGYYIIICVLVLYLLVLQVMYTNKTNTSESYLTRYSKYISYSFVVPPMSMNKSFKKANLL